MADVLDSDPTISLDGLLGEYLDQTIKPDAVTNIPRDADWVLRSFVISTDSLSEQDAFNRNFSSADLKYTNTSPGGNLVINPPPQFTKFSDIRRKGIRANYVKTALNYVGGDPGMGRYYAEAIEDTRQEIHLRFGVPDFNSMTQFLTGFHNSDAGNMARTGRLSESFITKFLTFTGQVIGIALAPLALVPMAIMFVGDMFRYFLRMPASKFYYLKPTMPLYYNAVQGLLNQIATNKGVIAFNHPDQMKSMFGEDYVLSQTEKSVIATLFPEIDNHGVINVYALANKAKRMQVRHELLARELFSGKASGNMFQVIRSWFAEPNAGIMSNNPRSVTALSLEGFWLSWIKTPVLSMIKDATGLSGEQSLRLGTETEATAGAEGTYTPLSDPAGVTEHAMAQFADGAQWISLRPDYTGSVSESFTSSAAPSSLADSINAHSAGAREKRINLADGNLDSLGITKGIIDGIGDVIKGAAGVFGLEGGFAMFAGSSFIDIPKSWESSSASLPKQTYTFTFNTPYGNPLCQILYQYFPLCCLLAGTLPLATGKQSYQSPFLVELYDRGKQVTRLGIIDSLSVTRGTANLGFTKDGDALGIEVSMSVLDLSSITTMPIAPSFKLSQGIFDADNSFTDYILALSGMRLLDTVNRWPMLKFAAARKAADISTYISSAHIASEFVSWPGVNMLTAVFRGTDRE